MVFSYACKVYILWSRDNGKRKKRILYSNEQPALVAALIDKHSQILGLHLNDGYGKRDDGLMVGSVHQLATIELLYHITKSKYQGPIYFDTFPDTD